MGEMRDKDIIRTRPLRVSPNFALPVDLDEGALHRNNDSDEDGTSSEASAQTKDGVTAEELINDDLAKRPAGGNPEGLPNRPPLKPFVPVLDEQPTHPPREIKVKSQTPRFAPDGSYVVDVVLEFNDIPGATGYEVRVTN